MSADSPAAESPPGPERLEDFFGFLRERIAGARKYAVAGRDYALFRTWYLAGSNTAAGHIETARPAIAQLPRHLRRRVLVRADSGGGTREFLEWLAAKSRRLRYSVGMTVTEDMQEAILNVPAGAWTPAYDGDGQARDGAWTGLRNLPLKGFAANQVWCENTPGPWNPAHPTRQSGRPPPHAPEITHQPNKSGSLRHAKDRG